MKTQNNTKLLVAGLLAGLFMFSSSQVMALSSKEKAMIEQAKGQSGKAELKAWFTLRMQYCQERAKFYSQKAEFGGSGKGVILQKQKAKHQKLASQWEKKAADYKKAIAQLQ